MKSSKSLQKFSKKSRGSQDAAFLFPDCFYMVLKPFNIQDASTIIAIAIYPAEQLLLQPQLRSFMSYAAFQRFRLWLVIFHTYESKTFFLLNHTKYSLILLGIIYRHILISTLIPLIQPPHLPIFTQCILLKGTLTHTNISTHTKINKAGPSCYC